MYPEHTTRLETIAKRLDRVHRDLINQCRHARVIFSTMIGTAAGFLTCVGATTYSFSTTATFIGAIVTAFFFGLACGQSLGERRS